MSSPFGFERDSSSVLPHFFCYLRTHFPPIGKLLKKGEKSWGFWHSRFFAFLSLSQSYRQECKKKDRDDDSKAPSRVIGRQTRPALFCIIIPHERISLIACYMLCAEYEKMRNKKSDWIEKLSRLGRTALLVFWREERKDKSKEVQYEDENP